MTRHLKLFSLFGIASIVMLVPGCAFTSDSLAAVVADKVASGEMTREAGEAVLAAAEGTIGYYAEHGADILLGAVGGYFGIDLRDRFRARRKAKAAPKA